MGERRHPGGCSTSAACVRDVVLEDPSGDSDGCGKVCGRRWYDPKGAPIKIGGLPVLTVEITFDYDSMLFEVHKRGKQVPVDWEGNTLWGSTDPYTARTSRVGGTREPGKGANPGLETG